MSKRDWGAVVAAFARSGKDRQRVATPSAATARQTAWRLRQRYAALATITADRGHVVLRRKIQ